MLPRKKSLEKPFYGVLFFLNFFLSNSLFLFINTLISTISNPENLQNVKHM